MQSREIEIELVILVDTDGYFEVAKDEKTVKEIAALDESEGFRLVRVKLTVPLPPAPIELTAKTLQPTRRSRRR